MQGSQNVTLPTLMTLCSCSVRKSNDNASSTKWSRNGNLLLCCPKLKIMLTMRKPSLVLLRKINELTFKSYKTHRNDLRSGQRRLIKTDSPKRGVTTVYTIYCSYSLFRWISLYEGVYIGNEMWIQKKCQPLCGKAAPFIGFSRRQQDMCI